MAPSFTIIGYFQKHGTSASQRLHLMPPIPPVGQLPDLLVLKIKEQMHS